MKKNNCLIYYLLLNLIMLASCAVLEPDTQKPEVKITFPQSDAVVGDSLRIKVTAWDNESVAKIQYYIDARHDSTGDDFAEPYEHLLALSQYTTELGSRHTIFAKAFDETENEMISNFVRIYYKWIELIIDQNETFKRDINKIFVRNTETSLQFRVEYNGEWSDPYQRLSGINCAVFLDTDSNSGVPQDTVQNLFDSFLAMNDSSRYPIGDISPDYLIVIGVEGDGFYKWDPDLFNWSFYDAPEFIAMENDTNYFEFGISLDDLQIHDNIDIIASNITFTPDTSFWDWVPDKGHIRYVMNSGLYIER